MKTSHFFAIICLSLLQACTIQKRTVNKGYFVQWNFKLKPKAKEQKRDDLSKTGSVECFDLAIKSDSLFTVADETRYENPLIKPSKDLISYEIKAKPKLLLNSKIKAAAEVKSSKAKSYKDKVSEANDYKKKRNRNIVLLALFSLILAHLIVPFIVIGEFHFLLVILHLCCLHVIVSSIHKIVAYNKLYKLKQKTKEGAVFTAEEKEIKQKFKDGKLIIFSIFIGFYAAFITVMAFLL